MISDKDKYRDKPDQEFNLLKKRAAEADHLRHRLVSLEKQHRDLQERYEAQVQYDPSRDSFEELKGAGIALGVDQKFTYHENHKTGLCEGQVIAVGTDGIWEARNHDGEMFGKARFRDVIRQHARVGAGDILDADYDELDRFARGLKAQDDITLVVIKIKQN